MKYTIYKTTNLINNKIYIGKHQTEDPNDQYLGSGKLIELALQKYGKEKFRKEVLYVFDSEEEMNSKEKELVTEEFCKREDTYNLCPGGQGGVGYINKNGLNEPQKGRAGANKVLKIKYGENFQVEIGRLGGKSLQKKYPDHSYQIAKRGHSEGWFSWVGKKHLDETKQKIGKANSLSQLGQRNSQYDTLWVTHPINGTKKIQKYELDLYLLQGYKQGRI